MKGVIPTLLIVIMMLTRTGVAAQDTPVIIPVQDKYYVSGVGVMVTGKIQSGVIKPGMVLEAKGRDRSDTVTVVKVYVNQKEVASATNEEVTMNIKGGVLADLQTGMVLATPGTLKAGRTANAAITLLTKEEGLTTIVKNNASVQVLLYDKTEYANLILKEATELQPGSKTTVQLKFFPGIAVRPNTLVTLKVYGKIIGSGIITAIED